MLAAVGLIPFYGAIKQACVNKNASRLCQKIYTLKFSYFNNWKFNSSGYTDYTESSRFQFSWGHADMRHAWTCSNKFQDNIQRKVSANNSSTATLIELCVATTTSALRDYECTTTSQVYYMFNCKLRSTVQSNCQSLLRWLVCFRSRSWRTHWLAWSAVFRRWCIRVRSLSAGGFRLRCISRFPEQTKTKYC